MEEAEQTEIKLYTGADGKMSEIYMTLCDTCAEKLDANRHAENRYYLTPVQGSRRTVQCTRCFQIAGCTQYEAKSKAVLAMERAMARQRAGTHIQKTDRRAHYREPWRER